MSIHTIGSCNSTSESSSATPAVLNVISISLLPNAQARSSQPNLEFVSSCLSTVNASTPEEESPPSENLLSNEKEEEPSVLESEDAVRPNISLAQPNLGTLPREILVLIQSFLDPASNNALSQTSHTLRNAADPAHATRLLLEREQRITLRELRRQGEQFTSTAEFILDVSESDNITDQDLESIVERFPNITGLSLRGTQQHSISDEGVKHISRLKRLITLKLINCVKITDAGLQQLIELNLTTLDLTGCHEITNVGLQYLSKLYQLTHLTLSGCHRITDIGLQQLIKLNLTTLDLTGCHRITNVGLQYLNKLYNLKYLNLTFCYRITDNGFQFLSKLYNLNTLDLSACSITDAGLQFLSQLHNLIALNLSSSLISDIGLYHLRHLHRLSNLNLLNCKQITDGGIHDLKQTLPNLNIEL